MNNQTTKLSQFFLTEPTPCSYLEDRFERKIFTHLAGKTATELNSALTQSGFRRSQNISYRPSCDSCNACISVRIPVKDFREKSSFRRIIKKNADIISAFNLPLATNEQYNLFQNYLNIRHKQGGMSVMSFLDYKEMVEETPIETCLIEYRKNTADNLFHNTSSELIATALTDILVDGLSMVYSFYSSLETQRSLGTLMILDHIEKAKSLNLPYVYLGFWVNGCRKMDYKTHFIPQEHFGPDGWGIF